MVPIHKIVDYKGNRYLLSRGLMKRARQINFIGDEELTEFNGKIVSLSLKQVLEDNIKFYLAEEEITKKS